MTKINNLFFTSSNQILLSSDQLRLYRIEQKYKYEIDKLRATIEKVACSICVDNPRNVILKHILWLTFVLFLGILVYPSYLSTIKNNTVMATLFSTIGIFLVFTIVAFVKPEWISLSWGPTLCFLLFAGIIAELCFFFFNRKNKQPVGRSKGFAYFFIALFTIYILYDTKKIQVNAKICKEATVDYINESLGIVLDAINLLQNLAIVNE